MSQDEIFTIVKKIVLEQLDVEESKVTPEANFLEDLVPDSLACLELILVFEQEFNIDVPDEEGENMMTTVQTCVDYINSKLADPTA